MPPRIEHQRAAMDGGLALPVRRLAGDLAAPQQRPDALDQQALGEGLLDVVVRAHAQAQHLCLWKNAAVNLTVTEFLIIQALAQRPGHVKSRDQLIDAAYGEHIYVDDRTIDSHIKRLRKKFKMVDDDFEMIETLYGVGYRFKET